MLFSIMTVWIVENSLDIYWGLLYSDFLIIFYTKLFDSFEYINEKNELCDIKKAITFIGNKIQNNLIKDT